MILIMIFLIKLLCQPQGPIRGKFIYIYSYCKVHTLHIFLKIGSYSNETLAI